MKVLAVLLSCAAFTFFFQIYPNYVNPNESSRFLLTAAIVDDHSLQIDKAIQRFGDTQDKSYYKGHFYTAKPIGYSLLAVPPYFFLRMLVPHADMDTMIWLLRFCINLIPLFLFSAFLLHYFRDSLGLVSPAYLLLGAFLFGTLFFPFAQLFMSHVLTGILWFLAFVFLTGKNERKWALLSGMLLGLAFLMEVLSFVQIGAAGLYLLLRKRSLVLSYVAGVVLLSLPSFLYNAYVFGNPLEWTYQHTVEFQQQNKIGYIGVKLPSPRVFWELTFGNSRGLFYHMPHLLFGVAGLLMERKNRWEAILAFTVVLGNILFVSSMVAWDGGWCFGPRYLVPVIPFLVYGTALWFRSRAPELPSMWLGAYVVLLAVTIPVILFGSVTFPFCPRFLSDPILYEVFTLFWRGFWGLNAGDVIGLNDTAIRMIAIVIVVVPALIFVWLSRLKPRAWILFAALLVISFPLSFLLQRWIEPRTSAQHCFAIGRAGYIQANYSKALEFFRYAQQRNPDRLLKSEIERYLSLIRSQPGAPQY